MKVDFFKETGLPRLHRRLISGLRRILSDTDKVAYDNVTHDDQGQSILDATGKPIKGKFSRGGPFGAALAISLDDGSLEKVGQARGNNVVGSGIASRHAEDQALQPDNYQALVQRLTELKAEGQNPMVWVVSSGQSCTNCHTKQEIAARDLQEKGVLKPGRFMTLYGATYDETLGVAQFYDAQYADAMIFASRYPRNSRGLIQHTRIALAETPPAVWNILSKEKQPTAVVMRKGEVYAVGQDTRTEFDPYATSEVNAVRAACLRHRKEGAFGSWEVDGDLYTTSAQMGPLLFAEAGWTKINHVKSVTMPNKLGRAQFDTQETYDTSNADFLKIVAGGYRHPNAAIKVLRDLDFRNTAQPKWAEMLRVNGEQLYNGAAVSSNVENMRNTHTRYCFAAEDICNCKQTGAVRPLALLRPLNGYSKG